MSYVRAIRAALPSLQDGGGAIVKVSSTAAKRPSTGMPHYSVTKAAVLSLSEARGRSARGRRSALQRGDPGPTATDAWLGEGGLGGPAGRRP